ncbi:hypothetical protein LCGC14_1117160 [marine sediment metagenome]|uniref:Uncharacterized protein n=1 Tax=marine sediment metagenome TaxID=412755 RepID=A0A0F9M4Y8_9ZZZZ
MTKIKYRKRKTTKVLRFNARNFDAEPGDLMVETYGSGKLYRLEDRRIGPMATAGELYPRLIKPPTEGLKAVIEDGEVFWVDPDTYNRDYR